MSGRAEPPPPDPAPRRGARRLRGFGNLAAKLLVSGGLLYWLLSRSDLETFAGLVQRADPWLFAAATGCFVLSNALGACQWYVLLRVQQLAISLRQAVVLYWVGVFFNNILLGNVGGDAMRIYDVRRLTGATSGGAAATFMDRFIGLFSTCSLALGACAVVAEVRRPGLVSLLASVWVALVVVLAMGLSRRLGSAVQVLVDRLLPAPIANVVSSLRASVVLYRHRVPLLLGVWGLSLAVQFLRIFVYWVAGAAVGLWVGLRYYVGFQPAAAIVAALPISVGGLGVREGILVQLFRGVGADSAQTFAMSLLGYAAGIAASLLGGIAFLARRIRPGAEVR